MRGVENSELVYAPARETTLLHCGARKADGDSEIDPAYPSKCSHSMGRWCSGRSSGRGAGKDWRQIASNAEETVTTASDPSCTKIKKREEW